MDCLIEFKDVSLSAWEGRVIFDHAGLSLYAGERVLLTAPVASGKSDFVRLMAGLNRPDSGSLVVLGADLAGCGAIELTGVRRRMGFVFQENILISNLRVIENVALPLLYHLGGPYDKHMETAERLLLLTGFRGDPWAMPGPLPPYAKKEVAVARALALSPEIVVCENLTEGMTRNEKEFIAALLIDYQEAGPERLLVFTADDAGDAGLFKPTRKIEIRDCRFAE